MTEAKKKMKIAILGWGSLLWEPGEFFNEWIELPWNLDGPELKIEFSRISNKRDGALTLVIDEANGTPTAVAWCLSKRKLLEDTVADLRCREETTMANIGRIILADNAEATASPDKEIIAWAKAKKIDAVVWTALESNFAKEKGTPFTVDAAVAHLKGLYATGKKRAAEYVREAPDFVQTKLRTALKDETGYFKKTPSK